MTDGDTLPRLLARNSARWPQRPAWRHKRLGIWQTWTWAGFAQRTNAIALGLAGSGFGRFDRLAVVGDNRPDLYAALLAAQALGGIGVPLDPETSDARLAAILEDAAASVVVADTVDQADRLHPLAEALSAPARVYCTDTGGMQRHDGWERLSLDALAAAGHAQSGLLDQALTRGTPQDLALLLYASDAATPHPLPLSHAQLLSAAEAIAAADPVRHTDDALCYLPMASYCDAVYSLALGLVGGFACNCPEAPDSILRDLREIGPTILFAPPAACTALADVVSAKADAVSGLKRRCFRYFQRLALTAEHLREQGRPIPPGLAIGCRIGELLAYAPVRDQLGLRRARWVHVDTPVPPDTARLLRALGVALRPAISRAPALAPAQQSAETQHA